MKNPDIVWTEKAVEWTAAAIYAQYLYDPLGRLPHFEELPERLKTKWKTIAVAWLEAIIPLLEQR